MTKQRESLLDVSEDDLSDLVGVHPKPKLSANLVREAGERAGFISREPRNRRRTGRTEQITVKAKPELLQAFYAVADEREWSVALAFEKALTLFLKEHKKG